MTRHLIQTGLKHVATIYNNLALKGHKDIKIFVTSNIRLKGLFQENHGHFF